MNTDFHVPATGLLKLAPLRRPVLDAQCFPMCGEYTEHFWLPIMGPSATWLVRRCAMLVGDVPTVVDAAAENHVIVDARELATSLGMSYSPDKIGPFTRALHRGILFNFLQPSHVFDDLLHVRTVAPPLPRRFTSRLPESIRTSLKNWHRSPVDTPVT